ncbi:MAG: valine--tRNA ligase, partial [Verrucomicrobia bacterium]|nr:valine--tRNA ligase [Verrucomicrobiota bacterium]
MEKNYTPSDIESKWYQRWIEAGVFAGRENDGGESYCVVIPPPNVTGILHMGHALNNTIQDVLVRWNRMQGRNTSWIPGTDHASIATETKVVQMLEGQGIQKADLSRDEFLSHAWQWKEKYGSLILNQLKRLGCSCDWDRLRFTMDEKYTRSVLTAFVHLYEKGWIYRGHRLVNWCPVSQSAISDEEVVHKDVNGSLWYFRYPIVGSDTTVTVATTRPETMLGDTAVAVNPNDERYRDLVGKYILLPLVGRKIPIIADDFVDPEFGTGCVKVTPAHDPNDFAIGERHQLERINIMNGDATLNDNVPVAYRGLTREKARQQVVADLDAAGHLDRVEKYKNSVGYSQRGDVPIEFYMSEQWFMKMDQLAKPALAAVVDGRIKIHPEHWAKTYQHWMENIQDWCISRQLWWGQRIPVWYRKGADRNDPAARHVSIAGPPDPENWEQDDDVLDTWASSWLWPFAVHDWPASTEALKRYYPSRALVTGPDILFFWVARMVMAGLEFMGEVPFSDVVIHGIVRDDQRRKMSKSLGNSIDPLIVVDEYSADALRFTLMMVTGVGQDILLSTDQFELGRNFGTKLWNACRFMRQDGNGDVRMPGLHFDALALPVWNEDELTPDDAHILEKLWQTIEASDDALRKFRLNDYAQGLYAYFWHEFCDWYIEYSKQDLDRGTDSRKRVVSSVMHLVMSNLLRLLHPVMPFLTEEIWHEMQFGGEHDFIATAPWPTVPDAAQKASWGVCPAEIIYVEEKHELIRAGRALRANY